MQRRTFHLGDILSLSTGRLVSLRHLDGVYDLLNFLKGEELSTQSPMVMDGVRPHLLRQFPWLAIITTEGVTQQNWQEWLQTQIDHYGAQHPVERMPTEDDLDQEGAS